MRRTDKLWGGFSLIQDDRFFKLGQDTMLLVRFCLSAGARKHHGFGLRQRRAQCIAVRTASPYYCHRLEIQPEVASSGEGEYHAQWLGAAHAGDLRRHEQSQSLFSTGSFDYVVCNPPYFAQNSGFSAKGVNKSTGTGRTAAERRQMPCELLHISSNLADAPRLFIGRNESVN